MKTCSACRKVKDLVEFNKNRALKDGLDNQCKLCSRVSKNKWRKANPDKVSAAAARNYALKGSKGALATKQWRLDNPTKAAMHSSNRYSAIKLRTPKWLTNTNYYQMDLFYTLAKQMTKETNLQFDVDHIIPLQGKYVSGLHVPWNLQVLSRYDNVRKGNK